MIKIIDKIKYLPKSSKKELIDTNSVYNHAYKKIVENIKKTLSKVDSNGGNAIVSINGKVSNSKDTKLDVSIDECSNDELRQKIKATLKQ